MSGESRVASIARYNKLFQDLLDSNTIDESYEKLVKKIPYRVIATNDEEGNPPRSSGISNPPVEADVSYLLHMMTKQQLKFTASKPI